jgi:hypothetical protein
MANLQYMQSLSLVRDGDVEEGLNHALTSAQGLPVNAARRHIAGQILKALPEKARTLPAAQQLRTITEPTAAVSYPRT